MPSPLAVPLSVLDLAPIAVGSGAREALLHSTELAVAAEAWGYQRYWVAEHHNLPGIASSAPAVLIGHLAAATSRLRIGSGGVMLPNHPPLVVAEQFGMLEALHPGRIDLGIGRAPGTDPATAAALRRSAAGLSADDFPQQLGELLAFFQGSFPDGHPYQRIRAVPGEGHQPTLWLLGSSGYSAQVAGLLGLPFSFAHHFSAANTEPALALYRSSFRPSATLDEPYSSIGVAVVCADDADRAHWLHSSSRLSVLRLRSGHPGALPSPEEASSYRYTPGERATVAAWTDSHVVGDPEEVASGLAALVARTGANELIVTTNVFEQADRMRSYQLLSALIAPHQISVAAGTP